jgi:hypothetical protein
MIFKAIGYLSGLSGKGNANGLVGRNKKGVAATAKMPTVAIAATAAVVC